MNYVDGFVVPVPKANLEAYCEMSRTCGAIWREYGALEYRECVADDVKSGVHTSFPQSVQMKEDETVVFAWIVYTSREQRDEINAKVMADTRMANFNPATMPFDGQRMFFGGFKVVVDV